MKLEAINREISLITFKITHIISSILGLAPCSTKILTRPIQRIGCTFAFSYSRIGCTYNILLIILYIGVIICGIPHMDELSYPNDSPTVRIFTKALSISGNVLAIFIIILYSILQREIIKIGNQLYEFDKKYGDKLIGGNNVFSDFRKLMTIIVMLVIWTGVLVTEIIQDGEIYLLTSGFSEAIVSWLLVQYGVIISTLKDRFEGINNALLATARCPLVFKEDLLFRGSVLNDRWIVNNLIMIKQARNKIYKVSCDVCGFYSFPVLLVIIYCCCCCIDSIYYYVMTLTTPEEGDLTYVSGIDFIFWTLVTLYPIVVLSASVHTFQVEADRTADLVYDIMETYSLNKDIESELNNFSLELLHKKVFFNACGFFSLDCTLLHSIFGIIVTYMLILVQFKPLETSTKN